MTWRQTEGPTVALEAGDSLTPTFTAPPVAALTRLEFEVTLTSSGGAGAARTETVLVYPSTVLSVSAGQDQDALDGATTLLHAELLAGGAPGTTFVWRQTGGRIAVIDQPNELITSVQLPRLSDPNPGNYSDVLTFEITAVPPGGGAGQAQSTVNLRLRGITASPRVSEKTVAQRGHAYAGDQLHLSAGVLNARAPISATWTQASGPSATFGANDRVEVPVNVGATGNYVFDVTVTDALNRTATGRVSVLVKEAPQVVAPEPPVQPQPQPPLQVTSAGGTGPGVSVFEGQKGVAAAVKVSGGQGPVTVTWGQLRDPGDPTLNLVVGSTQEQVSFDAPGVDGDRAVRLQATISDGTTTITRTFRFLIQDRPITVQVAPVPDSYINKPIDLNARVTGGVGPLSHAWTQVANGAPDVSAQLPAPGATSGPHAHLVPTQPGHYVVKLEATDGLGNRASEQLSVLVEGIPRPMASAPLQVLWPPGTSFVEGEAASVGIAVTGARGPVAVTWSVVDVQGLSVSLVPSATDPAFVSFVAPAVSADTSLRLQAVVTDGLDTVTSTGPLLPIINRKVTVSIIPPSVTDPHVGTTVTLATKASGTAGTARYQWSQVTGKGTLTGAKTDTARLTPSDTSGDTLRVTVTDDLGNTASDQITIKALRDPMTAAYSQQNYAMTMPSDAASSVLTGTLNVTGGSGRFKITHQPTARLHTPPYYQGKPDGSRDGVPLDQVDAALRPEFLNSDYAPGFKLSAATVKSRPASALCSYDFSAGECEIVWLSLTTQVTDEVTGETRRLEVSFQYKNPISKPPPPDLTTGCAAASTQVFDAVVQSGGTIQQYQCLGPITLCEKLAVPQDCPVDQPYGLIVIDNRDDATRTVDRRCASRKEVEDGWFTKYSSNDRCTRFDFGFVYTNKIYCEIGYGHDSGNGAGTTPACGSVTAMNPWKP